MENSISRFTEQYAHYYGQVARELRNGRKESHWMWFIFPQIKGLGRSSTAVYYAIRDLEEAKEFLRSPCGEKMQNLLKILLEQNGGNPELIFGYIDAMKLASSMTLFAEAAPENPVFLQVLDKFYKGKKDGRTLSILSLLRESAGL